MKRILLILIGLFLLLFMSNPTDSKVRTVVVDKIKPIANEHLQSEMKKDLKDNPFAGIASAMMPKFIDMALSGVMDTVRVDNYYIGKVLINENGDILAIGLLNQVFVTFDESDILEKLKKE